MEEKNGYDAVMFALIKIFIGEIIIDDSTTVTIFGYLPNDNNELRKWDFVCSMQQLTDMLLHAGVEGETLINIISESVLEEQEDAFRIDAENLFGNPVEITGLVFIVYCPREKDKHGEYTIVDTTYYFIDNIQTTEDFELNGLRESIPIELTPEEELEECIVSLIVSYKHYIRLVEDGVNKRQAQMDSAIENDDLFNLAELYYKIRKELS